MSIAVILFDSPSLFELEVISTTSFMLLLCCFSYTKERKHVNFKTYKILSNVSSVQKNYVFYKGVQREITHKIIFSLLCF